MKLGIICYNSENHLKSSMSISVLEETSLSFCLFIGPVTSNKSTAVVFRSFGVSACSRPWGRNIIDGFYGNSNSFCLCGERLSSTHA